EKKSYPAAAGGRKLCMFQTRERRDMPASQEKSTLTPVFPTPVSLSEPDPVSRGGRKLCLPQTCERRDMSASHENRLVTPNFEEVNLTPLRPSLLFDDRFCDDRGQFLHRLLQRHFVTMLTV